MLVALRPMMRDPTLADTEGTPAEGRALPRDSAGDSTIALLRDPYRFISKRCAALDSDAFETRLLFAPTICLTGAAAAELFYDERRFARARAAPVRVRRTLFGRGAVQTLDGFAHRHRKRMLMAVLSPERIADLANATAAEWRSAAQAWRSARRIVLYDVARELLTRTACEWAGVPLAANEAWLRCRHLTALFDGAGALGPRHWAARLARKRSERWLTQLVTDVRRGNVDVPDASAIRTIADHRELGGARLSARMAAVELLNVLRPTVAVAVYVTFCAHALHAHPQWRQRIAAGELEWLEPFVHEVRRFYPFVPAVAARVRRAFEWCGLQFPAGRRALLDLYGTNHDPRIWDAPGEFRPERFLGRTPGAFELIPQGGAESLTQHRCAGEALTVALMKTVVQALCSAFDYTVPQQDLAIDFARLPALPKSRFVIANVRPAS